MTIYWITDEPWPTSAEVLAAADDAGAEQVLHGIPERLADIVPSGTTGLLVVEDDIEVLAAAPLNPTGALAALLVCLSVIPSVDAANAVSATEQALIDEVLAWSLGNSS